VRVGNLNVPESKVRLFAYKLLQLVTAEEKVFFISKLSIARKRKMQHEN
jgi:hypothetical protein